MSGFFFDKLPITTKINTSMKAIKKFSTKHCLLKSVWSFSLMDLVLVRLADYSKNSRFATSMAWSSKMTSSQTSSSTSMKTDNLLIMVSTRHTDASIRHRDRSYPEFKKVR